jgi:hypothetical protein
MGRHPLSLATTIWTNPPGIEMGERLLEYQLLLAEPQMLPLELSPDT